MIARSILKNQFPSLLRATRVNFRIVFADHFAWQNKEGAPEVTIHFKNASAEWNALAFGHIGLLESYFNQSIDIEGDLHALFRAAFDTSFSGRGNLLNAIRNYWHEFRFSNRSIAQAKANARFHYDLGTDFFRYWLDHPYMMYTCAYWKEGTKTIEEAQQNKIEHVCKKLRLTASDSVADVGCGWGGFMFYAHEHYGVRVTGCNAATEQVVNLDAEIKRRKLQDSLKVVEQDFREFTGQFDKCAHIGVLEHAGRGNTPHAIKALADCLKPGGIGVLHYIGHAGQFNTEFFIRKHVFPGGWIPSLAECIDLMEKNGLEILDIENLRRHYALTLDAWAERFEDNWDKIQALNPSKFNEHFRRVWRTYLFGCAEMFRSVKEHTHLFQIVFSKGNVNYEFPMSRAYIYSSRS